MPNQVYLTHNAETEEQKEQLYQVFEDAGYLIRAFKITYRGKPFIALTADESILDVSELEKQVGEIIEQNDLGELVEEIHKVPRESIE